MSQRIESMPGMPGMEGAIEGTRISLLNSSNQIPQRNQVAIGTIVADTEYQVIIDAYPVAYTSTALDTATTIGSNLAGAINLAGLGMNAVSDPTTGDITLDGYPGENHDVQVTGGGGGFTLATLQAAATSAPIKFGRVVVTDVNDDLGIGRLPSSDTQMVRGISLHVHKAQDYNGGAYYHNGEEMAVKATGSVWVKFEGFPDKTLPIHYRYAAAGDFTEVGTLTSTPDGGTTELVGAKFLHIEGNLAEILVSNL